MARAHFGVMVPQIKRTWDEARTAATAFASMGYDSLWVNDHLYGPQSPSIPMLEAWTLLASLAALTDRVELGTLVTPAGMRNPTHLGKTIATVDHVAGGRVIPGFGAGWMPREFTDFNVPFLTPQQRVQQLRETVQLLKRMWSEDEEEVTFEGKYVRAENVVTQPKPARRVPIMVGGGGEQVTLKIAAQEADIWNNPAAGHGDLARKIEVLREHCQTVGRDPSSIRVSQQCLVTIAANDSELEPMVGTAKRIFGGHMGDPTGPLALTGTPDHVAEQVEKHIELGCTMFMIEFFGRDTREPAQLFADTVLPRFR
jgi:alkanesulfonate monooxygenase SsuD/methylene tetrahydromethanopterin reductase-like flavin-dependent oxidoreductase (luciferase family)